jgi:hypothetical protein
MTPLLPVTCNCACQRCLDGGCCMLPNGPAELPTATYTSTTIMAWPSLLRCSATDHHFEAYPTGGLYCRKCGEHRP